MSAVGKKSLFDWVFRPKHDYLPGTTIFRAVDIELLSREMEIEQNGSRDGAAEVPSSTSSRLTKTESAIVRRCQGYWEEAAQGARRAHEGYTGRANSLSAGADLDTLAAKPSDVSSQIEQLGRSNRELLRIQFSKYQAADEYLTQFRLREGLERPPQENKPMIVKVALLLAAFVIELAVNVGSFAAGDEFGLFGALFKMIAVPFLNIGAVFFLIFLIGRQCLRRSALWKLVGISGILIAVVWAIGLNLALAHLRDNLSVAMSIEAGKLALHQTLTDPLNLNDIYSWLMFSVGCVAAVLAGIDAFIWEDPHPGYSKAYAAKENTENAYFDLRENALALLDDVANPAIQIFQDTLRNAEKTTGGKQDFYQRAEALAEDVQAYQANLIGVANELVSRYQEANQHARKSAAPSRFERPIDIKLSKVTLGKSARPQYSMEDNGLLKHAISQVAEARENAANSLLTLGEMIELQDSIK